MKSFAPIEISLNNISAIDEQSAPDLEFGQKIREVLKSLMGYSDRPVSIKGEKNQVRSLTKVLGQEKKFLENHKNRGPDHPSTKRNKFLLEREIENFERIMGIDWPIKE